ncbi:MAG: GntR family transcriptional regulator [Chitinivibrionales bacterium]|nr:GntR family transcriptional regulator [Chitinivibrionales bacterium]
MCRRGEVFVPPVTAQFEQWLRTFAADANPGARLPTFIELSRTWDLSEKTVRMCVKRLADEGLVTSVRGKGTFVGGQQPVPPAEFSSPLTSSESLHLKFRETIFAGELKIGESLPPVKNVCIQFGVSEHTVSTAYRRLTEDGLVVNIGKRFLIGDFSDLVKHYTAGRVVIFDRLGEFSRHFTCIPTGPGFSYMEQEFAHRGIAVRYERLDRFRSLKSEWTRARAWPRGLLFAGTKPEDIRQIRDVVERCFSGTRTQPCSVLVMGTSRFSRSPRSVHFLSGGNLITARARAIASFAARKRFSRLRVFVQQTENRVTHFALVELLRVFPELHHLTKECDVRFHYRLKNSQLSGTHALEYVYHNIGYPMPESFVALKKYEDITPGDIVERLDACTPFPDVFARADENELWFFADDENAGRAVEWCRSHGRAIPETIAVLGMENSRQHLPCGISTCIPDWQTIGYCMAHAVIGDIPIERTSRGSIRTKFLLLHRLTTTL